MPEDGLGPAAALVRTHDPALFRALALSGSGLRERLMLLHALDIELGRAVVKADRAETGPLIARMRLQWWQDLLAEAAEGAPPRAHEIAAPLALLVREAGLPAADLVALVEGHVAEIEADGSRDGFDRWADRRFGALLRLSLVLAGAAPGHAVADPAARALALAHLLRTAPAMAAAGRVLMPGLVGPSRAALARGETEPQLDARARQLAAEGLAALAEARRHPPGRTARRALLPLRDAGRLLERVTRHGMVPEALAPENPARQLLGLLARRSTGRIG